MKFGSKLQNTVCKTTKHIMQSYKAYYKKLQNVMQSYSIKAVIMLSNIYVCICYSLVNTHKTLLCSYNCTYVAILTMQRYLQSVLCMATKHNLPTKCPTYMHIITKSSPNWKGAIKVCIQMVCRYLMVNFLLHVITFYLAFYLTQGFASGRLYKGRK